MMPDSQTPVWSMRVAYDGAGFSGWQVQQNARTVQGELNTALARLYTRDWRRREAEGLPLPAVRTQGCSRTDAGVHALDQRVSFEPPPEPPIPPEGAFKALNSRLPDTIRILSLEPAEPGFNARRAAVGKAYTYILHRGKLQSPFMANYLTPVGAALDIAAIQAATAHLIGEHDFRNFTVNSEGQDPDDTVRSLDRFVVREMGRLVLVTVVGERFLYKMVRRLVGCLVAVGEGRMGADDVPAFRDGPDRGIGPVDTAAPQGLYLERVFTDPTEMAAYSPGVPPFTALLGLPS